MTHSGAGVSSGEKGEPSRDDRVTTPRSRISHDTLVNFTGQGIAAVAALVCAPFVVHAVGIDRFGLLSLVWVVVGYFSILDFGFGPAVTRSVSAAVSGGQRWRVPSLFWAANRIQLYLSAAGTLALGFATPALVNLVLNVPAPLRGEATISLYMCALGLPAVVMSSSVIGLLQAARRFDLTNAVQVPLSVSQFVVPLACALVWPNLPFIVATLLLSRVVALVALFYLAFRVFPELSGGQPRDPEAWRSLATFGGWITVSSIISPLMVYADRFLLGHLRTLAVVSYYSVPSDAATRLLIVPRSLFPVLFPVFSGSQDPLASSDIAARALKYTLILVGLPVVVLIVLAGTIMTVWMGPTFAAESTRAFQILLVGITLNSLAYVPSALTQAAGRADVTAKLHMIELPLYALVAYGAIDRWGINGAAAAWLLRMLCDLALLLVVGWRVAGLSPSRILDYRLPQLAVGWLTLGAFAVLADLSTDRTSLKLLLAAAVAATGMIGIRLFFLRRDDLERISGMLTAIRYSLSRKS